MSGHSETAANSRPRIVIVGAGFGGLACAHMLGNKPVDVTIVDRRNFHLFMPLLYQVATAMLSPADIAQPIRSILRRFKNVHVIMDEAVGVDFQAKRLRLGDGESLPYDMLVLATGSEYSYYGHGEWMGHAPGLKTIEDAQAIRARLLIAFELAERSHDPQEQAALVTTIIVGGGPTGVEMAGSVVELDRRALARDFRHVEPQTSRTILVEAGPRILPGFPETLAAYAHERLQRLGVTIWTNRPVEAIEANRVKVAGEWIEAGTVVWAAGVQATSAASWIPGEHDGSGRVIVAPDLSVPGLDGVFVIGDLAHCRDKNGKPLVALAQVAEQQGKHLGRHLSANALRGTPLPPFEFRDRGNTAIIGRNAAVFDFGRRQLKGFVAWLLWALIHVYFLVGFEQRLLVSLHWLWQYLTYRRGARLILPTSRGRKAQE